MNVVVRRPIQALTDTLINQIAAGEVIERPASIVKELLENSLDAGASTIKIEVTAGGIDRIVVSDDGHGIPPSELALALRRHCTSKIAHFDDLDRIVSLGFRGEALASIGAVADLTITSRTANAEHAWSVHTGPRSEIAAPIPGALARGTTITVSDLFAAIPARRQFLRRPQTELLHIQQLLRGAAFCVPGVTFSLRYDERQWQAVAARDERSNLQRWRAVFGAEFARDAIYLDVTANGIRLFGWLGPVGLARNQADLQYLAVNGRLIRDRQLAHAIRLAYGAELGAGQFASFALHLEVAADEVDVNVHPSKAEVRFRRLREVHDLIYAAIRQALTPTANTGHDTRYRHHPALPAFKVAEPPFPISVSPPRPEHSAIPATEDSLLLVAHRFLLFADEWALRMVDLEELVLAQLQAPSATPAIRYLMFPARLPSADWRTWAAHFAQWGFELNEVGPQGWVIRGVPVVLPVFSAEVFGARLVADAPLAHELARAVARAVCLALEIPPLNARAAWFNTWREQAEAQGIVPNATHLDVATLAQLFAHPKRPA
jgi:DNA mismatch repair protein MutL